MRINIFGVLLFFSVGPAFASATPVVCQKRFDDGGSKTVTQLLIEESSTAGIFILNFSRLTTGPNYSQISRWTINPIRCEIGEDNFVCDMNADGGLAEIVYQLGTSADPATARYPLKLVHLELKPMNNIFLLEGSITHSTSEARAIKETFSICANLDELRYPKALQHPKRANWVYSPYDHAVLDVGELKSGAKMLDPNVKKIFIVP